MEAQRDHLLDCLDLAVFIAVLFGFGGNENPRVDSAIYWPKIISNGETHVVAGSWMLLHFGQLKTWVPVSLLPSAERQSETDISHELMQERPGLQ